MNLVYPVAKQVANSLGLRPGQAVFERNPDYWRGWEGDHFERIVVKIVKEASVQEQMIDSGVADLGNRIPVESSKTFDQKDCCSRLVGPSYLNYALHLNTQKPPFDNKKVRQAVSYAMPYKDYYIWGATAGMIKELYDRLYGS